MVNLILALSLANFAALIYLTYIIYRKNKQNRIDHSIPHPNQSLKIALSRFNPFNEVGGDQSFILCLLDNTNSGVIITSLHNRELTRVYAKAVKDGSSASQAFSQEEKKAIIKAINS
ncbi:MAG: DUF4446 family protein [Candidatus Shapirobacteria bacterium]|jgi:hypothetical protein